MTTAATTLATTPALLVKIEQPMIQVIYLLKKNFVGAHCTACGILAPQPGIEPGPLAVRARSPNHWTTREFPDSGYLKKN